jgi:hypothetical protein
MTLFGVKRIRPDQTIFATYSALSGRKPFFERGESLRRHVAGASGVIDWREKRF